MSALDSPPRSRPGARAGPRIRHWQVHLEPQAVPDAEQRLDRLYRRLLEMAQQSVVRWPGPGKE